MLHGASNDECALHRSYCWYDGMTPKHDDHHHQQQHPSMMTLKWCLDVILRIAGCDSPHGLSITVVMWVWRKEVDWVHHNAIHMHHPHHPPVCSILLLFCFISSCLLTSLIAPRLPNDSYYREEMGRKIKEDYKGGFKRRTKTSTVIISSLPSSRPSKA